MWPISRATPVDLFESLEPKEVLYEFDMPRVFSLTDREGELYLAFWCDEDDKSDRYVVVPTSKKILAALKAGQKTVREALEQPRSWVCDVLFGSTTCDCFRIDHTELPDECLPKPGTMLLPSLEPLLTLRAQGEAIVPGQVPGSVIRSCIEGPQRALKLLSEYVLAGATLVGKPSERIRRLFDLPTQRVAFSSFEISFRLPEEEPTLFAGLEGASPEAQALEEVRTLLNAGFTWLESSHLVDSVPVEDFDAAGVVLRAIKEITPSSNSQISKLEISGQLVGPSGRARVVSSESRRCINKALQRIAQEPVLKEFVGRVRELDKDRLTFELRESADFDGSLKLSFEEDLLEDVLLSLSDDLKVRVVTRYARKGSSEALAVLPIE